MLNSSERDRPLGNLDVIGWGLWAIGMGFEVIADFQKSAFRRNPNNKVTYLITLTIFSIIYVVMFSISFQFQSSISYCTIFSGKIYYDRVMVYIPTS